MKIIKDFAGDPIWDLVGQSVCDFRPTFNGNLVNLWTCILPTPTIQETKGIFVNHTREIAKWVLSHREQFSPEDRFQIIVGWPVLVRESGRQVIKIGGTVEVLSGIADGTTPVIPRPGWTKNVQFTRP